MTQIIEAAEAIGSGEVISMCPLCQGRGWDDPPENQLAPSRPNKHGNTMPACRLCKGRKFVYLNRICECGSAAVWYEGKAKVWSCGRDLCIKAAVRRVHGVPIVPWTGGL